MPAVGLVALQHVFGERHVGAAVNRDVVVVVQGDQFAQLAVSCQGAGFRGNAFLVAAVAHHHIGVVVDEGGAGLVELGGQMGFSDRQAHSVGDTSAEGAGRHFNAWGFKGFGVPRGLRSPLTELLDVVDAHRVVTGEVLERIQQHAAVSGGQHEAVAVEPLGVLWVVV